ncbi:MAG TPA: peptidase S58 family protein [Actinobacteria bacterium]|nr:peptidase S58 family protein [Actinomycetota bacterium]
MADRGITAIPGVLVGHWTDPVARTGVTAVELPVPNVAVVDVRGGAPGVRETGVLEPAARQVPVDAVVFSGGSAFGLAAADGVVDELRLAGRGVPTPAGPVPIVPAAIIYDLAVGEATAHPGPEEGRAAWRSRSDGPVPVGRVGAGTGATVGNWRGVSHPGGVGSASVTVDGATVGALVVVNAAGDVFDLEGRSLTGGRPADVAAPGAVAGTNTTLVLVVVDGRVGDRGELRRAAIRAHDALGACLRPAHTRYDGDTVFVVACGEREVDVDLVQQATFVAVGRAVASAVAS